VSDGNARLTVMRERWRRASNGSSDNGVCSFNASSASLVCVIFSRNSFQFSASFQCFINWSGLSGFKSKFIVIFQHLFFGEKVLKYFKCKIS